DDVDAAIAGLSSAQIKIFPSAARLVVKVNGQQDLGSSPVSILSGTQAPISFDLTDSVTSRGTFQYLSYDCGNSVHDQIQGNQTSWKFTCAYNTATGTK